MAVRLSRQIVDYTLTPREADLQKTFFNLLKLDDRKLFSADDFFSYGLDRYLSDPAHMIGSFFRKLQHLCLIEQAGYVHSSRPSNNCREIRLWRFKA
jgi:hypothetical protein